MNEWLTGDPHLIGRLEWRLARMEAEQGRRTVAAAYAACYAVLAGIVVVLSFFPILGDVVVDDGYGSQTTYTFGSIWEMAGQGQAGNAAGFGALLMIGVAVMLVVAVFRTSPGSGGLDAAITAVAALLAVMLVTKLGTGAASPPLTGAGQAGIAILILTAMLGVAHLTYALSERGREAKLTHGQLGR